MRAFIKTIGLMDQINCCHEVSFSSGVNIVTGRSSTGKSAIIEIFDYCFGNSDYTVPAGIITDCAALYFCIIQFANFELLLARKPDDRYVYIDESVQDALPQIKEQGLAFFSETLFYPLDKFKPLCGQYFGLNIDETDESAIAKEKRDRKKGRPSIRHATSYILQHQNLIANKQALFYRFDEKEKREQTIEQLKIFLGFVDAEYFIKKQELSELQEAQKKLRRDEENFKKDKEKEKDSINSLLLEYYSIAGTLLFAEPIDTVLKYPGKYLKLLKGFHPDANVDSGIFGAKLENLEKEANELIIEERSLQAKLAKINASIRYAEEASQQSVDQVQAQIADTSVCPFCETECSELGGKAKKLYEAILWLNDELGKTSLILDSFVAEKHSIEEALREKREQITLNKNEQAVLFNSINELKEQRTLWEQLMKIVLRVEISLDKISSKKDIEFATIEKELTQKITTLKEELSRKYDVNKKMKEAEDFLIASMNSIGSNFPFEKSYFPVSLKFSFESFDLWFEKGGNKIYLRSMGSGANWLYCHLSLFLAFNKMFCKYIETSVIPPIIFIDQPSQVYFPTQVDTDSEFNPERLVRLKSQKNDNDDLAAVTNLYDQLCAYVDSCQKEFGVTPQIIVTDHADHLTLKNANFEDLVAGRRWRERGFILEKEE